MADVEEAAEEGGRLLLSGIVTGEFVDGIVVEGVTEEGGRMLLSLGIVTGEFVDGVELL
jgi:hypothetical protein